MSSFELDSGAAMIFFFQTKVYKIAGIANCFGTYAFSQFYMEGDSTEFKKATLRPPVEGGLGICVNKRGEGEGGRAFKHQNLHGNSFTRGGIQ